MTDHCAAPQAEPTQSPRCCMKLTFGLALDGFRLAPGAVAFGELTCGPAGILGWLEARLGLRRPAVTEAQRVAVFRQLLEQAMAAGTRFYSASFKHDPLAVAETLLGWRDELVLAGWDGTVASTASTRLRDLAEIERLVANSLPPGVGDRLCALLRSLDASSVELATVQTVDELAQLPKLWRLLLTRLEAKPVPAILSAPTDRNSDLALVQAALNGDGDAAKLKLRQDGSLVLLTAYSEYTLAQGAAQWLQGERVPERTLALLADDTGRLLEEALLGLAEPALGIHAVSAARTIPQVLLLALRLHWKPLNPRHLLEFLTHPACPVTGHLRHRLVKALQASPGIGGPRWLKAVEEAQEQVRDSADLDATQKAEALQRIEDDLKRWLLLERHDPAVGVPGVALARICNRVAQWAGKRSGGLERETPGEAELYRVLSSQAVALADLVRPPELVGQMQLLRLLEQVGGGGCASPAPVGEVGHCRWFRQPASVIESSDTVVWWNFCEAAAPALPRWTAEELASLGAAGAEPLAAEVILARQNAGWLRAVRAARGKLVLAFPRQRGGEPVRAHPLLAQLQAVVAGNLPTVDVDACLRQGVGGFELREMRQRPLAQPQRWWKLSRPELLSPHANQSPKHPDKRTFNKSFSSENLFVFAPFAWVFGHRARLRSGALTRSQPTADMQIEGTLLHRLFDLLLAADPAGFDWRKSDRATLERFVEECWPQLCEQQAAHLLLPGRRAHQEELLATSKEAMWRLFEQLRQARVVEATTNSAPPAAAFVGGTMGGYLDLLVKNEAGEEAVVDLKLGGLKKRGEELANNLQLQLAVYAFLRSQAQGGRWPVAAYFILNDAELIAQEAAFFPAAQLVQPESQAVGVRTCWEEFNEVWRWREGLLQRGFIEVNVAGTEPSEGDERLPSSMPPLERWFGGNVESGYNEFSTLTGWKEGQ